MPHTDAPQAERKKDIHDLESLPPFEDIHPDVDVGEPDGLEHTESLLEDELPIDPQATLLDDLEAQVEFNHGNGLEEILPLDAIDALDQVESIHPLTADPTLPDIPFPDPLEQWNLAEPWGRDPWEPEEPNPYEGP